MDRKNRVKLLINKLWKTREIQARTAIYRFSGREFSSGLTVADSRLNRGQGVYAQRYVETWNFLLKTTPGTPGWLFVFWEKVSEKVRSNGVDTDNPSLIRPGFTGPRFQKTVLFSIGDCFPLLLKSRKKCDGYSFG